MSKIITCLLFFTHIIISLTEETVIRNRKTNLVLDGSDYNVKLQTYTKRNSQMWYLQGSQDGTYVIVNKDTGKALDIEEDGSGAYVITTTRQKREPGEYVSTHQWKLNQDGTIANYQNNLVIDVEVILWKLYRGSNLILYPKMEDVSTQIFDICSPKSDTLYCKNEAANELH